MTLFKIKPDENFFEKLADTFINANKIKDEELLDYIFIMPSQQAIDSLKAEFLKRSHYLLPPIYSFDYIPQEKIISMLIKAELFEDMADIKQVCSTEEQVFFAHNFINQHCRELIFNHEERIFFAKKLIEAANESKLFETTLSNIDFFDLPLHFEQNYRLLLLFTKKWQEYLDSGNKYDFIDHNLTMISKLTKLIRDNKLMNKLVLAGTTCSKPSILRLVKAAHKNQNCHLVFWGMENEYLAIHEEETHPQYLFNRVKQALRIKAHESCLNDKHSARRQEDEIIHKIFLRNKSDLKATYFGIQGFSSKLKIMEAEEQTEEINIVKSIILDELHCNLKKKILVISNSPSFSIDLLALLKTEGIYPTTGYGKNLKQTKIYEFLWLIDKIFFKLSDDAALILAFFKHEYFYHKLNPSFELALRGHKKGNILEILKLLTQDYSENAFLNMLHSTEVLALRETSSFNQQLKQLVFLAEVASNMSIWQSEPGNYFSAIINNLTKANSTKIPTGTFFSLFTGLIENHNFTSHTEHNANIAIHNSIGARLLHADVVIISSFNENTFPDLKYSDSIIPRSLRKKLSLPTEEIRIGQQAFDLYCHLHKNKVYITRAKRDFTSLNQESRWLKKIKLLAKLNSLENKILDKNYSNQYNNFYYINKKKPYTFPSPKPAAHLRPTKFSATDLEKMTRDPYYIYCKKILKLKELEPLNKAYDQADYGNLVHSIFEKVTISPEFDYRAYIKRKIREPHIQKFWKNKISSLVDWLKKYNLKVLKKNINVQTEAKKILKYIIANQEFEITVKTDRVEINKGSFVVFDYKTTKPPTNSDLHKFHALQLQIGALAQMEEGYSPSNFEYIELKTDAEAPIFHKFKSKKEENTAEFILATRAYLLNLLKNQSQTSYSYNPQPEASLKLSYNPYSHLARLSE